MVTAPEEMAAYDLSRYDGVLAFGEVLRALYRARGIAHEVFTWHEAADTRVFRPLARERQRDLVWIGNWGDGERGAELREFLLEPARALSCPAQVYGVRYPNEAIAALGEAGVQYCGFMPNYRVPEVFARHRLTVHVPRRPYVQALRGIPTIRMFEALACGIPLVSAPWYDDERLFRAGSDFLFARDGGEMTRQLRTLLHEPALRAQLATSGLATVRARHTCRHRVDELLAIFARLGLRADTSERERSFRCAPTLEVP
jgi:spore maturation protein CgeB